MISLRSWLVLFLPVAALTWWFLHDDPEERVRHAHEELVRLVSKSGEDANSTSILNARALQKLFADPSLVSGDAESLVGTYSPEEMVRTVISVQALFSSIDLTLGELTIGFPSPDEAVIRFQASLDGQSEIDGHRDVVETRDVTSRMREIDGNWLFTGFQFAVN